MCTVAVADIAPLTGITGFRAFLEMNDGASRTTEAEGAVFSFLEQGLAALPLDPTPDQLTRLTSLVELLSVWGARINLTGHRDPLEMAGRLILDAAALSEKGKSLFVLLAPGESATLTYSWK